MLRRLPFEKTARLEILDESNCLVFPHQILSVNSTKKHLDYKPSS